MAEPGARQVVPDDGLARLIQGRPYLLRLANWLLPLTFAEISLVLVVRPLSTGFPLGWDAIVYTAAARALLSGGDPWQVMANGIAYAAPPPSLLPYLPFTSLPDAMVAAIWILIASVSAIYSVRRLGLPWWWLLFPPLVLGIITGGTAVPVLALLVRGGAVSEAMAVVSRAYAAVPLLVLTRLRGIAVALLLFAITAPFLSWGLFAGSADRVAMLFQTQTEGLSAVSVPWLIPIAIACLVMLGRRRAAWLLVPALWPSTQLYYGVIALPVLAESRLIAVALAIPGIPGLVVAGLAAQVIWERLAIRRRTT